jgi:hypothetical protein
MHAVCLQARLKSEQLQLFCLPDASTVVAFSAVTGEACMAKVTADTAQATAITAAVAMMRSMRTKPS